MAPRENESVKPDQPMMHVCIVLDSRCYA
jgi:hypothetical protein